eukprot:Lankesteria_metandrocarpae@DN9093_c0_g1_i1.p1
MDLRNSIATLLAASIVLTCIPAVSSDLFDGVIADAWDASSYSGTCKALTTPLKRWTIRWFASLSNGKLIAAMLEQLLLKTSTSSTVYTILSASAPWMVLLCLGVLWLIVAIVISTCISKNVRKWWVNCTSSSCCKRRPRKELEKVKKKHVLQLSVSTVILSVALISSAVLAFVWSDLYRHQFLGLRCDLWTVLKESMLGGRSLDGEDSVGFIELEKSLQGLEDIHANRKNSTILELVKHIDFSMTGTNDLETLFRSVQSQVQSPAYQHYCVGCLPEYIADSNETLTEAEGLASVLAKKILSIFATGSSSDTPLTDFLTAYVKEWQEWLISVRAYVWFGSLFVESVFALSICMGIVAAVAAILLWWAVGEIATSRRKAKKPSKRSQKLLGFLFSFYAILGSIALLFIGAILMLGGYSNGGCYFVRNNLRELRVWNAVFGGTDFGEAVRQCVVLKQSHMFLKAQEDSIKDFNDTFVEWKSEIDTIKLDYVKESAADLAKLPAIKATFPDYSWIVVPDPASTPTEAFPEVVMSSLLYTDYSVSCDAVSLKYDSPLATACGVVITTTTTASTTTTTVSTTVASKTVNVYGLESLNKAVNDNSIAKNWCLASVLSHTPTAVGCADPSNRQTITASSQTTDKNIQNEYNNIKAIDPSRATGWLHAVRVSIQKEKLLEDRIFSCPGVSKCPASDYMPFVTAFNYTASPFVNDADSRIELMQTTIQAKVDDTAAKITAVADAIQTNGVDVLTESNKWASCSSLVDWYRLLTTDLCDSFLPSISVLPIATFLLVLASLLGTPILWIVYCYILDLRKEGSTSAIASSSIQVIDDIPPADNSVRYQAAIPFNDGSAVPHHTS